MDKKFAYLINRILKLHAFNTVTQINLSLVKSIEIFKWTILLLNEEKLK